MNQTTRILFRSLWRAFFMGLSNSGLGPREQYDRPIELRITSAYGGRVSSDLDRWYDANAFQPLAIDPHVLDREQQQAAANEERRRSKDSSLRPATDDLAKLIFLEAIGKDLLATAGATVDEHGDRLAPLHVREFAGALAISDMHRRRSRVEQIKILGDRPAPTIARVPD